MTTTTAEEHDTMSHENISVNTDDDLVEIQGLPADPSPEERTSDASTFEQAVGVVGADAEEALVKYTEFPTVSAATAPSISVDAAGVPVVTIPMTTKAKAYASLIGSTVTTAATGALAMLGPDTVESHVLTVVVAVVGVLGTVLGVHQATNLPDVKRAAKHS